MLGHQIHRSFTPRLFGGSKRNIASGNGLRISNGVLLTGRPLKDTSIEKAVAAQYKVVACIKQFSIPDTTRSTQAVSEDPVHGTETFAWMVE